MRNITDAIANSSLDFLDCMELGSLDVKRDLGYTPDYVGGVLRMLQTERPDTYVLAKNRTVTVREFLAMAAGCVGMELVFEGAGEKEIGIDRHVGQTLLRVQPKF